jgi:cytochrome c2
MKKNHLKSLVPVLLISLNLFAGSSSLEDGKTLFMSRCASCHAVHKNATGPALAGVLQRHPMDWVVSFVHSSQSMIKAGDTAALNIYNRFNKTPMPDQQDLSDTDIKDILAFIQAEEKNAPAPSVKKPYMPPVKWTPITIHDHYGFYLALLGLTGGLVAALWWAVRLNDYRRQLQEQKTQNQ